MPRNCPLCRWPSVPPYRAVCARCWRPMPAHIAVALLTAWQSRVTLPHLWEERLAAAQLWYRDRTRPRAARIESGDPDAAEVQAPRP